MSLCFAALMPPLAVEADIIAGLRRFAAEIARQSWFAACGEPLTDGEQAEAAAYLAALGLPGRALAPVGDWRAAALTTRSADWSRAWWEAEAALQAALKKSAARRLGEDRLLAALSEVMQAAEPLDGMAALALSRAGIADPALTRVAAGAAAQACHHAALALAAAAGPDHAFAVKYRLFAAGRWPLGIVGERFFVF